MAQQQEQTPRQDQSMVVFEGFSGLNTQASRYGIGDKECAIMDGWFPAGNDNAKIIPDNGPATYTAPAGLTVAFFDFVNFSGTPVALVGLSDGSVVSYVTTTGASATIAGPGTIQNPGGGQVGVAQWGAAYAIIVSAQTDGYFVWDGGSAALTLPGQTIPSTGGVVPTGVSGTTIETYQSRVWVANGASVFFSAPGSVVDFSSAGGGGDFTSNDSSLRVRYTALKAANGYLYLFGDSSLSYLANPQTSGSPLVTTYSLQNADPEVGTSWPATVDVIGSNIVFANSWGAQVSLGGRIAKISDALDGVYDSLPGFGGLVPSAAKAILFGRRVWTLLLPVIDQVTLQPTRKLFIWDEKRWCSASQSVSLTAIQHQEVESIITAWGTDGASLYRLFQTPSTAVTKTLRSKFWAPAGGYARTKSENRMWGLARLLSGASVSLDVSVDSERGASSKAVALSPATATWTNNVGTTVVWTNNVGALATWFTTGDDTVVFPPSNCGQAGALVGFTITTTAAELALVSVATMPVDVGYRG